MSIGQHIAPSFASFLIFRVQYAVARTTWAFFLHMLSVILTKQVHGSRSHLFRYSGRDWVLFESSTSDYIIRAVKPTSFPMMQ